MATVTLTKSWVTLVSTATSLSFYTGRGKAVDSALKGEVRQLAGGRFRSVAQLGTKRTQTFQLRDLALTDLALLETWLGQTVLVRDTRGRRIFGVFLDLPYIDRPDVSTYFDVTLTVLEVSFSEDV